MIDLGADARRVVDEVKSKMNLITTLPIETEKPIIRELTNRAQVVAIAVTSQLPVEKWHDVIGDPTFADAILDLLVHNAYRLDLKGDSMRKRRRPSARREHSEP